MLGHRQQEKKEEGVRAETRQGKPSASCDVIWGFTYTALHNDHTLFPSCSCVQISDISVFYKYYLHFRLKSHKWFQFSAETGRKFTTQSFVFIQIFALSLFYSEPAKVLLIKILKTPDFLQTAAVFNAHITNTITDKLLTTSTSSSEHFIFAVIKDSKWPNLLKAALLCSSLLC